MLGLACLSQPAQCFDRTPGHNNQRALRGCLLKQAFFISPLQFAEPSNLLWVSYLRFWFLEKI